MKDKYNLWYQFKILSIVFSSLLFLAFFWFYVHNRLARMEEGILSNWTEMQYKAVETLVDQAVSSEEGQNFDDFFVRTVVPRLTYTETSDGFFYKNGKVVFENNAQRTEEHANSTIRDTYGSYSYDGGGHLLEVLEEMEKGASGTDYFIKDHFKGKEHVTWIAFNYYGSSYITGIATPETFILNRYGFENIKNDTYAFSGIYTFIMVLFAGMLCFSAYRGNRSVKALEQDIFQTKEAAKKDRVRVGQLEESLKLLTIKDSLTGLYNRKYFDALTVKLKDKLFLPLSICIVDIDGFKGINTLWGYEKGDEILKRVAEIGTDACDNQDDVLARYGNDEIAILMINTPYGKALEKAKRIQEEVLKKYSDDIPVEVTFGIATKTVEEGSICQTVIEAEEQLYRNKTDGAGLLLRNR